MKTQRISAPQNVLKTIVSLGFVLAFFFSTNTIYAQNTERTVSGVVKTLDGPLLGATIVLKGTSVGISSDENGLFTFPKPLKENDVLVTSFLGYMNKEIVITDDTTFVEPFLEDIAIGIVGAFSTEEIVTLSNIDKD